MTPKYLNRTGPHTLYMGNYVLPEVRAMFAAMMSRVPKGGIEARYWDVVERIAKHDHEDTYLYDEWDALSSQPGWADLKMSNAEEWLTKYTVRVRSVPGEEDGRPTHHEVTEHKLHPVIQEFFDTHVGKYGHGSIKELTGQPVVFIEGISFWAAYLTFDNPLVKGQEMSTRAVWRRDWPQATDATGSLKLHEIHKLGLEIAWHELEAWKAELQKECEACRGAGSWEEPGTESKPGSCEDCEGTGKKYPWMNDPQAFRPAFDRARWAIPGTCSTGVVHTADVRTMGRVLRVMEDVARSSQHSAAIELVEEIKDCYREAMPGMADLWLREAVHGEGDVGLTPMEHVERVPYHLNQLDEDLKPAYRHDISHEVTVTMRAVRLDPGHLKRETRTYLDPWFNQMYDGSVTLACSWACARDWHRHRPMMPWMVSFIRDPITVQKQDGSKEFGFTNLRLHHMYEPKSEFGREHTARYMSMCSEAMDDFMAEKNVWAAMLCAPLGTKTYLSGGAGAQDLVYMAELRAYARGANFEYKAQAEEMLRQIKKYSYEILQTSE